MTDEEEIKAEIAGGGTDLTAYTVRTAWRR